MSWTSVFRLALHLLPAELRRKHGLAMEALFTRELGRARVRGRLHVALVGAGAFGTLCGEASTSRCARGRTSRMMSANPVDERSLDAHGRSRLAPTSEILTRHS